MPVNCRTCRFYQASIVAKYARDHIDGALPYVWCADLKDRKSWYERINGRGRNAKEANHQKGFLDL